LYSSFVVFIFRLFILVVQKFNPLGKSIKLKRYVGHQGWSYWSDIDIEATSVYEAVKALRYRRQSRVQTKLKTSQAFLWLRSVISITQVHNVNRTN